MILLSRRLIRSKTLHTSILSPMTRARNNSVAVFAASTSSTSSNSTPGAMLRFQDSLPRLPVPALEETAERYLKSIHPIVSSEQLTASERLVRQFISTDGDGPRLQRKLLAKAADPAVKNWLYEWWNYSAYLAYRDPVVPYVSYFYAHKDDPSRRGQAARAAALATATLQFKTEVDSNTLEPEYLRKSPLCMNSYKWMFNASRVPAPGADYPVKYDFKDPKNKTILVIRKNRFYILLHDINGIQLSTVELEAQFQRIINEADALGEAPAIGALTSENRDKWVEFRNHLVAADPVNSELLERIQAASFVVALDDSTPVTLVERARNMWHGDGANRFYDKPVQFIVCQNGVSGFMGEHSMMDGTPTCRLNDYVNHVIFTNKVNHGSPSVRSDLPAPEELKFVISDQVKRDVAVARSDFAHEIGLHELSVVNYQRFGKNLIKKFKTSPDAFAQMVIQLGYFKRFGVSRPTYESAATRQFQNGRTETCRTVSDESVAFVKAFTDPTVDNKTKIATFRRAIDAHVKYISEASAGHGVDRHFFGLKNLVEPGQPIPELFKDPTFAYSSSWYLSTSQLSSEYFNGYGWSQVIDDGFGIAYMVNNNSLNFNVVSKKLGTDQLAFYLNEAANDLADVLSTELEVTAKL
ncbi:acyltransferase ChoActase/COT/CPT [Lipomyces japonicus]|uniref:acyltransferase ChoActase/COT/CPT n=1 Tax=Lipomyces japonicus TaxID=56871 RepID=UPI0034CF6F63